jgi:hypothetical protein
VGATVGDPVGTGDGALVGPLVGDCVGTGVGDAVGTAVGATVGLQVGVVLGDTVGAAVGDIVLQTNSARQWLLWQSASSRHFWPGAHRGQSVCPPQSTSVSLPPCTLSPHLCGVGAAVGEDVGALVGVEVGATDGAEVGIGVGLCVGVAVGAAVGRSWVGDWSASMLPHCTLPSRLNCRIVLASQNSTNTMSLEGSTETRGDSVTKYSGMNKFSSPEYPVFPSTTRPLNAFSVMFTAL